MRVFSRRPGSSIGFAFLLSAILLWGSLAQQAPGPPGPPGGFRKHTANRAKPLQTQPANQPAPGSSRATFTEIDPDGRQISANGIPDHPVGAFPNRGNPNVISEQGYDLVIPKTPRIAAHPRSQFGPFGIALNGVVFDPGAAEFWQGDPSLGWNYEALGGAVALGIDENHAHVQPTGTYHYHGLPVLYLKQRGVAAGRHSPQIGWAADGFPIYALYGYAVAKDSSVAIKKLKSSYRLKEGRRPSSPEGPGGSHDGAFVQDYEYVEGLGDLDECQGRFCVTPEFPEGTYAYFLTEAWPVIPRLFKGEPVPLRQEGRRPGGEGRPPPGAGPPPRPGREGHRPPFPPPPGPPRGDRPLPPPPPR